jgi:hypothetical protein
LTWTIRIRLKSKTKAKEKENKISTESPTTDYTEYGPVEDTRNQYGTGTQLKYSTIIFITPLL